GGSRQLVPTRNTKTSDRSTNARIRAEEKLGQEGLEMLAKDFVAWDSNFGDAEWQLCDGIILTLLRQGLSQIEIRAVLPVGGSRVFRLQQALKDPNYSALPSRRVRGSTWHALTADEKEAIRAESQYWELEDGFPCAHRRPRQFFGEEGLTWSTLWHRYADRQLQQEARVVSKERWRQYTHFYYPGLRLTRVTEDDCDACTRLKVQLDRDDL
ncbi:hypothetical protein B484DRAFT_303779, partial [Ochromonadaceae sp. CCMP2298]